MRILWLADELRAAGLTVVEHAGWRTRGWEPWEPRYGIVHATAAPRTQSDETQVAIVRDGRVGLQGPIAVACVDRTGRWHVLASGRCNTALTGWAGPATGVGNVGLLGVEACNDNGLWQPPEPWPDVQYEAYARGWAAICRRMGWGAARCIGHKEHQPDDKSDPLFNMDEFRARVAALIEEDDMALSDEDVERIAAATAARTLSRIKHMPVEIFHAGRQADGTWPTERLDTLLARLRARGEAALTLIRAQQPLLEAAAQGQALTAEQVAQVAAAVAAAVPAGLADELVDELGQRLSGPATGG